MKFFSRINGFLENKRPYLYRFSQSVRNTGASIARIFNLKKSEDWLATFTSLLLRLGAILLLCGLLIFLWRILSYQGYTIQQFNVPKNLTEQGFDEVVVARKLEDHYLLIKNEAVSIKEDSIQAVGDEQQPELNVDVLGVGFSLRSIGFYLRDLLGRKNNIIKGEITSADDTLILTLRMSGFAPEAMAEPLAQGTNQAVSKLLTQAAELILGKTDPYRLAVYYNHQEAYSKAIEVAKQMLVNRPTEMHWAYLAWGMQLEDQRLYEDAMNKFELSLLAHPDFPLAWVHKSFCLQYLNRHDEAIEALGKLNQLKPDEPSYWNYYANALSNAERYEESDQAYQRADELDPEYAGWLFNWADRKIGRQQIAEAKEILGKAMIKAEKNNDFLNLVKAKIYIAFLDQDLAAIEEYAKLILSLEPDNAFTIQSLTSAYFGTGNYEAAIETGKLIIPLKKVQGQKQRVLNQIAMASNFIGNPDSAMAYVQQAIAVDTTVGYPYSTLAETYHYLGDRARFLYFLELSFKKGMSTSAIRQTDQPYQEFWEEPDFQALLKKYTEGALRD